MGKTAQLIRVRYAQPGGALAWRRCGTEFEIVKHGEIRAVAFKALSHANDV
jgi:hypothetical protein